MDDAQAMPRDLWPLIPQGPDDAHALFDALREQMGQEIVGHDELVARLALAGTRHMTQDLHPLQAPTRILLVGGPGTGKTMLARTLARALQLPWVLIPVGELAETNWSGTDLPAFLSSLYDDVSASSSPEETARWLARAVVIFDDLDRLRLPGRYTGGSGTTRDYQVGRQRSVLSAIGDGTVPIKRGSRTLMWRSNQALVVCCARFSEIEADRPSPSDLRSWGLTRELAEVLCAGTVLRVPELGHRQTLRILTAQVSGLADTFEVFGYSLEVSAEALRFVVDRLQAGDLDADVRHGLAWLADVVERLLLHMIDDQAPPGTTRVLAPDDLHLPSLSKGMWRE